MLYRNIGRLAGRTKPALACRSRSTRCRSPVNIVIGRCKQNGIQRRRLVQEDDDGGLVIFFKKVMSYWIEALLTAGSALVIVLLMA
jgi:hypothetical protein